MQVGKKEEEEEEEYYMSNGRDSVQLFNLIEFSSVTPFASPHPNDDSPHPNDDSLIHQLVLLERPSSSIKKV